MGSRRARRERRGLKGSRASAGVGKLNLISRRIFDLWE